MTTSFGNIRLHISRHAYTRGNFKGEAPADGNKRKRNYERVRIVGTTAYARKYSTDVLAFHEDGSITIDANSWMDRPTTRQFVNDNIRRFAPAGCPLYGQVTSIRKFNLSTLVVSTAAGWTPYYDGVTLDPAGHLVGEPHAFKAKRVDTDETRAFAQALKDNGFTAVFPLLHSTVEMERYGFYKGHVREQLVEGTPEDWANVIGVYKFTQGWRRDETGTYKRVYVTRTPKETWAAMMTDAKARMTMIVPTDTFYV